MASKKKDILVVGTANIAVSAVLESLLGGQNVTLHIISDRDFSVNEVVLGYASKTNTNLYGHEMREMGPVLTGLAKDSALIAFIDESLTGEQRKVCVELSNKCGKLDIKTREFDFSVL